MESGFPLPTPPQLTGGGLTDNFADSVVICIIGFVETIVAAKLYATKVFPLFRILAINITASTIIRYLPTESWLL